MRKYGLLIFVLLIGLLLVSCDPNVSDEDIKNYTLKSIWLYEQNGSKWTAKLDITEIKTISFQKVKPLGTPVKEWNVDNTDKGYIKCYVYATSGGYNLYFVGSKIFGNADSQGMFAEFENLTSISFGHFDTSYVENMDCMFCGCKSIKNLDLSSFNLSKVTSAEDMFSSFGTVGTTVQIASGDKTFFNSTALGDTEFWEYKSNIYTCIVDPAIDLTVTFKDGGDEKTKTVSYGDTIYLGSYIPEKNGYGFFGWYTDKDCTEYFDGTEPIKKDTTLYAKWIPGTTTAYVDASITLTELTLSEGDEVTAEFSANNYTLGVSAKIANANTKTIVLDSFAVATSGTITVNVYSSGGSGVKGTTVLKGSATENVEFEDGKTYNILVRDLQKTYYRVTFDTNGGSSIDSQVVPAGKTASEPYSNPTKSGNTFAGWYAKSDFSGSQYNFSSAVNSDLTLYAKWETSAVTEKWCVMTYMDFSTLTSDGLMNLDEICQTTPNANVKAYFITGGSSGVSYSATKYPNLHKALGNPSGNPFAASASVGTYQYWEYTSEEYTSEGKFIEITPLSKGMNDPNVLLDFINKCYSWAKDSDSEANFKYILELWDHGGGSYGGLIQDSTFSAQPMEGVIMSLSDCATAIKTATNQLGFKFEVVIFDMCLMQSIESAHAISYNCANYIIGSQTSSSAIGSAYTDWFNYLYANPGATGKGFGKMFCDTAYNKLRKDGDQYFIENITWSVLDMSKLAALETAYENYSSSVLNTLSAQNVESYLATIDSNPAFNPKISLWEYYMYDINVFTNQVGSSEYRTALMNAVNNAIVYKKYGTTTENEGCCGLSMCILTTKNGWEDWGYSNNWNTAYFTNCLTNNYRTFQKKILGIISL